MSSTMKVAAMKVARVTQYGTSDEVAEAKQELKFANIEAAIQRNLATAPPLTPAQIKLLSGLLRTGRQR